MSDDDVFHSVSMVMNVDPAEIARIVHDYINRGIVSDYDRLNCPKPPIYIGPVKVETLKERLDNYKKHKHIKEDNKMKATSVQKIENVNNICFSIENHPAEMESKLVIVASTNDDIFEFEFKGPELIQQCKAAGLFTGWEKYQRIRELEKELGRWKKEAVDCLKLRDEAQKEAYKLKQENEKLKELKTPTIENFEEPSSRSDILDLAKKCVCGQREQDYGTPESNFKIIADLWNNYLGLAENGDGVPIFSIKNITPTDVSMMMALMKIARIKNGGGSGDSFVDLAGYAACGGEIWHSNKETNGDSSQETN